MSCRNCKAHIFKRLRDNQLKGDNFLKWEESLKDCLDAYGLGHTIKTQIAPYPEGGGDEAFERAYTREESKYDKACSILVKSLSTTIADKVEALNDDPYHLMIYLQPKYGYLVRKRVCKLKKELFSFKMDENE